MSGYTARGASNRSDLFIPSSRRDEAPTSSNHVAASARQAEVVSSSRDKAQQEYGVSQAEDDPLQLEHILGYAGEYRRTLLPLPGNPGFFIKRC